MPTPPTASLDGIVESALFVKDLGKARTFYQGGRDPPRRQQLARI